MMGRVKLVRIVFFLVFAGLFGFFSWYLYQKQNNPYTYLSFRLDDDLATIWIPDMDRLANKLESVDRLQWPNLNTQLENGLNKVLTKSDFSFNKVLGASCLISYNDSQYVIAFENVDITTENLASVLRDEYELSAQSSPSSLKVDEVDLSFSYFGSFSCLSNFEFNPSPKSSKYKFGNADYTIFDSGDTLGVQHILSRDNHFRLWESNEDNFKGKPVEHRSYIERIPSGIDEMVFYGSTRLNDDVLNLFGESEDSLYAETYAWIDQGVIYIRKDSFELIIAPENTERDLGYILEDETLELQQDSGQIAYFNIGTYEIMPFDARFSWRPMIKELGSELNYFSQYLNYNILSNSIPAMRWYFGQIQLGNMFLNNNDLKTLYESTLPDKSHYLYFNQESVEEGYRILSKVGTENSCLYTEILLESNVSGVENYGSISDFIVEIIPDNINIIKDSTAILVNNRNQMVLYNYNGVKQWRLDLSTDLIGNPQVIDLENDGIHEFVLFQANQIDLIDGNGKSKAGFPKIFNGISKGGVAVNYDNAYDYRFLVNIDNKVVSINESGKYVQGWEFTEMMAPLKGSILYYVSKGKDVISFADISGEQYVLNRRGGSRVETNSIIKTKNQGNFLLGNLDDMTLHTIGYSSQYIYNYYLLDGNVDSVELDDKVVPQKIEWKYNNGNPLLIVEENERVVIFDKYGYKKDEVLKPNTGDSFEGVIGTQDFRYVFIDNSQNNLYLLNSFGKMLLPNPYEGTGTYSLNNGLLYTFVNSKLKIYMID